MAVKVLILVFTSVLKMETAYFSETLVIHLQIHEHYFPEDQRHHFLYNLDLSLCDLCVFGSHKKDLKGSGFGSDGDMKATMVQWLQQQCGGHPSAVASVGCLPEHPWGLFLMALTTLSRTIYKQVSFEHGQRPVPSLRWSFVCHCRDI
jgi:hypothetical protein